MALSPTQQKVVDQRGEFTWIGGNGRGQGSFIICPGDSDKLYGTKVSAATLNALRNRGIVKHGQLSDEQREEMKRRQSHRVAGRRSIPTHGYLFQN